MSAGPSQSILHVSSRESVIGLRDQILRLHGYQVDSTLSIEEARTLSAERDYSLVLIDVEGDGRIPMAEKLCADIKHRRPEQNVVFICNYRISAQSDCPDEIIRAEFNPKVMIEGLRSFLDHQ
jgi:DNA-binding NtrC family response regulator